MCVKELVPTCRHQSVNTDDAGNRGLVPTLKELMLALTPWAMVTRSSVSTLSSSATVSATGVGAGVGAGDGVGASDGVD